MNRRSGLSALCCAVALAVVGVARPAWSQPCYMDSDEQNPGSGVPLTWLTQPIKYWTYIKEGKIPDKAQVLAAIKAAFQAYQDIECTTLQFEHAGEEDEVITGGKSGGILVYFGHDAATWIYGNSAYFRTLKFLTVEKGDIDMGVLALNAKDWDWTVSGAEANKLDIQTAVTQMIPNVLGYHASDDPINQSLQAITFNHEQRALTEAQIKGAQHGYFDKQNASCTGKEPVPPALCGTGVQPGDGTPAGDGTPPIGDGGTTPTGDSGTQPTGDSGTQPGTDAGPTGDGGIVDDGVDDDGCCRVSHARSTGKLPFIALIGLALLIGLLRRRR